MNKRYLYIIIVVVVVSIIGLIIYKSSIKNKPIDIKNTSDEDIQRIKDSINRGEFKIDIQDIKNFANVEKSIELARKLGVPEEKIIKNRQELDKFMLN